MTPNRSKTACLRFRNALALGTADLSLARHLEHCPACARLQGRPAVTRRLPGSPTSLPPRLSWEALQERLSNVPTSTPPLPAEPAGAAAPHPRANTGNSPVLADTTPTMGGRCPRRPEDAPSGGTSSGPLPSRSVGRSGGESCGPEPRKAGWSLGELVPSLALVGCLLLALALDRSAGEAAPSRRAIVLGQRIFLEKSLHGLEIFVQKLRPQLDRENDATVTPEK